MTTTDHSTVAITGIGIVGPTGIGTDALWTSLMKHRSGVVRLEGEQYEGLPARHAAPIADFDLSPYIEKRAARRMGRFAQFALVAGDLALTDAGLDDISGPRTAITIHSARFLRFVKGRPLYSGQLGAPTGTLDRVFLTHCQRAKG